MSYKTDVMMRFSLAIAKPRFIPEPEIIPIVYKQPLKDQLRVLVRIGIKGFITLYLFEKKQSSLITK